MTEKAIKTLTAAPTVSGSAAWLIPAVGLHWMWVRSLGFQWYSNGTVLNNVIYQCHYDIQYDWLRLWPVTPSCMQAIINPESSSSMSSAHRATSHSSQSTCLGSFLRGSRRPVLRQPGRIPTGFLSAPLAGGCEMHLTAATRTWCWSGQRRRSRKSRPSAGPILSSSNA